MSADLKVDLATRDLVVENGDFVLIYDDEALIQRLYLRLSDVKGDWFRDTTQGVDYIGRILGKRSDLTRRTEFRRVVLGTEGVASVSELKLTYDNNTRTLTMDLSVIKTDGLPLDVRFSL